MNVQFEIRYNFAGRNSAKNVDLGHDTFRNIFNMNGNGSCSGAVFICTTELALTTSVMGIRIGPFVFTVDEGIRREFNSGTNSQIAGFYIEQVCFLVWSLFDKMLELHYAIYAYTEYIILQGMMSLRTTCVFALTNGRLVSLLPAHFRSCGGCDAVGAKKNQFAVWLWLGSARELIGNQSACLAV